MRYAPLYARRGAPGSAAVPSVGELEELLARAREADPVSDRACGYCEREIGPECGGGYCSDRCRREDRAESERFMWRRRDLNRPDQERRIEMMLESGRRRRALAAAG